MAAPLEEAAEDLIERLGDIGCARHQRAGEGYSIHLFHPTHSWVFFNAFRLLSICEAHPDNVLSSLLFCGIRRGTQTGSPSKT